MYDPKNAIPQFHPSGNAEMDLRMRASQQRIHQARRDHRPKNTANTYEGMQQEFLAFCDRNFGLEDPTRHTVTGSKVAFYIEKELSQRKKLRLKHGEDPNATLSANTIEIHLAAIVDLWRDQRNKGINSFPHPRIECEQFMDTLARKENKKKREEYQDRAALTVGDGYTTVEELTALIDHYIAQNSEEGLRNALICLLSHYMYLRGASARQAELADLQSLNFAAEGPTPCPALLFLMTDSKSNKHGAIQISGCMRSKFTDICPLMMLSFYLFYRFQCQGEAFPNMTTSRDWFDIKLFKGSDRLVELSSKAHFVAIKKGLSACRIQSSKATHIFRGAGARMADVWGVDESEIRRNGQWNSTSMNRSYLTGLPRRLMRQLAGFPREEGHFYLPRGMLDPPEELKRKVFPDVELWQDKITAGTAQKTTTADGFLKLLISLRTILLQDSVIMRRNHPDHHLWEHDLFQDPLYLKFRDDLIAAMAVHENNDPFSMQLRSVVPHIEQRLSTLESQLAMNATQSNSRMDEILNHISDISTGRAPLNINITIPAGGDYQVPTITSTAASTPLMSLAAAASSSTSQAPITVVEADELSGSAPTYRMSRGSSTLPRLWKEWHDGIGGGHSVQWMDQNYPGWFSKDKTFYSRRRRIIMTIKKYAEEKNLRETTALDIAEAYRLQLGRSVDYLSKHQDSIFADE